MSRIKLGFFALLLLALPHGSMACLCAGDDDSVVPADARPPAEDALNVPVLAVRSLDLDYRSIYGLKLTADDNTLVFCSSNQHIGFIDAESLELTKVIEVPELAALATYSWACRMSIIGEFGYAFFTSDELEGPAGIAKISLAAQTLEAFWMLPEELWGASIQTKYSRFEGLRSTLDPSRAVLTYPSTSSFFQGISVLYVDLDTGAFENELIVDVDEVRVLDIYSVIGGDKILGLALRGASSKSFAFLASLTEGKTLWRHTEQTALDLGKTVGSFNHLALDPAGERLLAADNPSVGWSMWSVADGALLREGDYVWPGFTNMMTWLPGGRLLHLTSGSRESWITVQDEDSLVPVATATMPPDTGIYDYALSADGRQLFVAASGYVCAVTLPEP